MIHLFFPLHSKEPTCDVISGGPRYTVALRDGDLDVAQELVQRGLAVRGTEPDEPDEPVEAEPPCAAAGPSASLFLFTNCGGDRRLSCTAIRCYCSRRRFRRTHRLGNGRRGRVVGMARLVQGNAGRLRIGSAAGPPYRGTPGPLPSRLEYRPKQFKNYNQ